VKQSCTQTEVCITSTLQKQIDVDFESYISTDSVLHTDVQKLCDTVLQSKYVLVNEESEDELGKSAQFNMKEFIESEKLLSGKGGFDTNLNTCAG